MTAEPLAKPGTVIKRLRGTTEEQIAALPSDAAPRKAKKSAAKTREAKRSPKPSRSSLEAAERKLAKIAERNLAEQEKLHAQEREIAEWRHALATEQRSEVARLEEAVDIEHATYEDALRAWES